MVMAHYAAYHVLGLASSRERTDTRWSTSDISASSCLVRRGSSDSNEVKCRIELSWSPWFWAEFNDWLLACRVIRIIGPWSSIPLLFIYEVKCQEGERYSDTVGFVKRRIRVDLLRTCVILIALRGRKTTTAQLLTVHQRSGLQQLRPVAY